MWGLRPFGALLKRYTGKIFLKSRFGHPTAKVGLNTKARGSHHSYPSPNTRPPPEPHRLSTRRPSTYVEISLQIRLFFAKRTQFLQQQKSRNSLCRKGLPKQTTPGHSKKTNPIEPNLSKRKNDPKPLPRKALWKNFVSSTPAKRTQSKPISVSAARFIVYKWRTVPEGPIHRFAARESRIERRDTKYEIREYDW